MLLLLRYFKVPWRDLAEVMNAMFVTNTTTVPFRKNSCRAYFEDMRRPKPSLAWDSSKGRFYREIFGANLCRPSEPIISWIDKVQARISELGLQYRCSRIVRPRRRQPSLHRLPRDFRRATPRRRLDFERTRRARSGTDFLPNSTRTRSTSVFTFRANTPLQSRSPGPDTPCPPPRHQPTHIVAPPSHPSPPEESPARPVRNRDGTRRKFPGEGTPDGLFYRVYCPMSQGENGAHGCWAANRFRGSTPSSEQEFSDALAKHVARELVPSPFVSVGTCPTWILRKGYEKAQKLQSNGVSGFDQVNILIINALEIVTPVYHVGYHLQRLRNSRRCPRAARWYRGKFERLVWQAIPAKAIIKMISLADIEAYHFRSEIFAEKILRLDSFRSGVDPFTSDFGLVSASASKKMLNSRAVQLGNESCLGLSKLIVFLGLTPKTVIEPEVLHCALYYVVLYWRLELSPDDSTDAFDQWVFYGARAHGGDDDGFYQRAAAAIVDLRDAWVNGIAEAIKWNRENRV